MPATRVYSTRERDWRDNSRSTQALPIPASPSIIENEGTTSGWTPWGTYHSGGFGETVREVPALVRGLCHMAQW